MQDTATISRTARVVDAIEQAERIAQLISDARGGVSCPVRSAAVASRGGLRW